MTKPRIISPCVAEKSTRDPLQRIAEFSTDHGGGLISIRDMGDHSRVEIYRCDPGVRVIAPKAAAASLHGSALDADDLSRIHRLLSEDLVAINRELRCASDAPPDLAHKAVEREGLRTTIAKVGAMIQATSDAPSGPLRFGITIEDGSICSVYSDDPRMAGARYYLIDYDTDESDTSDLFYVPQDTGEPQEAWLSDRSVEVMDKAGFDQLAAVLDAGKSVADIDAEDEA